MVCPFSAHHFQHWNGCTETIFTFPRVFTGELAFNILTFSGYFDYLIFQVCLILYLR